MANIINNNTIIRNYIIITLSILISILCRIKNNIFDLYYFQYSKITLKIKGIGSFNIIGNEFEGLDYLKKIFINGNEQSGIKNEYDFNQTNNFVELLWDDDINNCENMFSECEEITEIDLSNFNASQVTDMDNMFYDCSSLTSINLSNFNTSLVEDMESMFDGCSSLTSLDLSNFDTSQVYYMSYMFYDCSSLTSLNLSNFDFSQTIAFNSMFEGCINLEYINLNNIDETKLETASYMFDNIPKNVVIYINKSITNDRLSQITGLICPIIDSTTDWKSKQNKLINNDNNDCVESCDNNPQYPYEYNGKCVDNCLKGFLLDKNGNPTNKCKCELDKCLLCPNVALSKYLCTKCNDNYYPIENDPSNLGEYINCYNNIPEGYYLDNYLYIKCYFTCKTCEKSGNNKFHNCIECDDNYQFKIVKDNSLNCYEKCDYYHYFDFENIYHCTTDMFCPDEYPKLNEETRECTKYDINDLIRDLIRDEAEIMSKEEEIEYYDNLINIIEKEFTSENYDTSKIDNGQNEVAKIGKITLTLTTLENEKSNINNNLTTIFFGVCENLLKRFYNLSDNETLYLKKIEIAQEGFRIPKVEYDVYSKLFGKNLTKLNITACEHSKILILISLKLNEKNLDILNSSSGYFNDICYTATTEDGTDITLKDRKAEFIDKNKTVCQEDCLFSNYNKENLKVQCSCKIKESSKSIADMNIKKDKLLENFKNIKSFLNFNFLICYKNLFNKEAIINNIGFYLIFSIIFFHIISIFVFYINGFILIKKKIKLIALGIYKGRNKYEIINKEEKMKNFFNKNKSHNVSIYKKEKIKKRRNNNINHIKPINDNSKIKIKINKKYDNNKKLKNLSMYIDEEINELPFDLAIQFDKRFFCQYYISLIKTKHSLISALFNNNDYNSKIIKIDLFFIGFTIDYIVNALFYNDDTMHKIYETKGEFDFETQIPIMVYSMIISYILNSPLDFLSSSNDAIIDFKQNRSKTNDMKRRKYLEYKLKVKFIFYFVFSFLLLFLFWYYISMFCAIYKNTQIHLLKDTLMSFLLSLLFPFYIYLIPGLFRLPALSNRKNKRECLYNFSKFLQSF